MSIFSKLRSFFAPSKKNQVCLGEFPLEAFAHHPLSKMMGEDEPFSKWRPDNVDIPEKLEATFRMNTWVYQMWIFYMIFAHHKGSENAHRVLDYWQQQLDSIQPDLGLQLKSLVLRIQRNVETQVEEPFSFEINGKQITAPIEYVLAVDFLTDKDAPFAMTDEDKASGKIPEFNGLDRVLGTCLEHGKAEAIHLFEPLIRLVNLKQQTEQGAAANP
jgi:hypothetical protein